MCRNSPSKVADKCDICGGDLILRKDDDPSVIRTRFEVYEKSTRPLVDYYGKTGKMVEIDASLPIEKAFNNVLKLPPNKYSAYAQVWIGIAREKSGQIAKAKLEYELYLKLYPDGADAGWVKARLSKLKAIQPTPPPVLAESAAEAAWSSARRTSTRPPGQVAPALP